MDIWLPSRRQFLVGAGAAAVLAACGDKDDPKPTASSSDSSSSHSSSSPSSSGSGSDGLAVAQFFGGPVLAAGGPVRAPIGFADTDGLLPVDDCPAEVSVDVRFKDKTIVSDLVVARHAEGLPRAYYPLVFEAPDAGIYDLVVRGGAHDVEASIQVTDPDQVFVPGPGEKLPSVATPTVANAQGVTPICTRDPVCPLHEVSVDAALEAKEPFVLILSTPAFCQQTICGPVLEVLLDVRGELDDPPTMIHAEIYHHPKVNLSDTTAMVQAMQLSYEPLVVAVRADGTIGQRVDFIFDAVELRALMGQMTA